MPGDPPAEAAAKSRSESDERATNKTGRAESIKECPGESDEERTEEEKHPEAERSVGRGDTGRRRLD